MVDKISKVDLLNSRDGMMNEPLCYIFTEMSQSLTKLGTASIHSHLNM